MESFGVRRFRYFCTFPQPELLADPETVEVGISRTHDDSVVRIEGCKPYKINFRDKPKDILHFAASLREECPFVVRAVRNKGSSRSVGFRVYVDQTRLDWIRDHTRARVFLDHLESALRDNNWFVEGRFTLPRRIEDSHHPSVLLAS